MALVMNDESAAPTKNVVLGEHSSGIRYISTVLKACSAVYKFIHAPQYYVVNGHQCTVCLDAVQENVDEVE